MSNASDINWWIGSNGNLFGDNNGYRYCVRKSNEGYIIARDGVEIARAPSIADAKLFVVRE